MSYGSVLCRLGDLLVHADGRLPDAERLFQAALDSDARASLVRFLVDRAVQLAHR